MQATTAVMQAVRATSSASQPASFWVRVSVAEGDGGSSWLTAAAESNTTDAAFLSNGTSGEESARGANIASPIVMFLAGLLGNVLALVVLHKTRTEIRSMMFYTLVAALTWNDLIGIVLTSPVTLAAYINGREMPAGDRLCRFNGFVMVCFGLSTPLIVCTMAIERSLALRCPYFYSKYCTPASARIVVVVLWAFVLVFGALPLFGFGKYSLQYPRTWCFLDFRSRWPLDMSYAYIYAVVNLLVVVLMTSCNLVVMATLCQVRDTRRKHSSASLNSSLLTADVADDKVRYLRRRNQRDVELQMIWLVCAITTIFAVCWVPLMVHILLTLSTDSQEPVLGLVAIRLASLNQTLNPWLYVILRKALLARIRRTFARCLHCDDDNEDDYAHRYPRHVHHPHRRTPPYAQHHNCQQYEGVPRGYVHVRNQLCPSSQFVGRQNEAVSLSDGSLRSGDRSRSRSGSRSVGRHSSDSDRQSRSLAGGDSVHLCSACRAHALKTAAMRGDRSAPGHRPDLPADPRRSGCAESFPRGGDRVQSDARTLTDFAADARPDAFFETPDGIYVDLFRQLPESRLSASLQVLRDPAQHPAAAEGSGVCRQQPPSDSRKAAFLSETDDHGYGSRVSTESSRTPSPDERRVAGRAAERSLADDASLVCGDADLGSRLDGSASSDRADYGVSGGHLSSSGAGGGSLSSCDHHSVCPRESSPGDSSAHG